MYHNTGGAIDYRALVVEDMAGLDYDAVEEDLVGNLQMNG